MDSQVLTTLERAIGVAEEFAGTSGASAALEWSKLSVAEQRVYDVALRHLEAASHADHMFRAMAGLFSGTGLPADTSVRVLPSRIHH